jgi:hypothetical protein
MFWRFSYSASQLQTLLEKEVFYLCKNIIIEIKFIEISNLKRI